MLSLIASLANTSALVIDPDPDSRDRLSSTLREAGVARVEQVSRITAARQRLEIRAYDIVLCEHVFADEARTGMDLVEDLRVAQLLPLSTVFLIVSAHGAPSTVIQTGEAALDGFVVKPYTQKALLDRVLDARARKRAIAPVTAAIDRGDLAQAATLCESRHADQAPNAIALARLGAELRLKLGQTEAAHTLFDAVMHTRALPWAKLGQARCQYQDGQLKLARALLESLVAEQPGYADAYDALGRVLIDQCEFTAALPMLRRSAEITPGSMLRQQKLGVLAFALGQDDEAQRALERATSLGAGSSSFDYPSLLLLALLQFDRGHTRALARSREALVRARVAQPESARLRRFDELASVLQHTLAERGAEAATQMQGLLAALGDADLDMDHACHLLAVLARVQEGRWPLADVDNKVDLIVQRFAVSKTTCELMMHMARPWPAFAPRIASSYQGLCKMIEEAVSRSVGGAPEAAVQMLLMQIEIAPNRRLMDVAERTLQRHREAIPQARRLARQLKRLRDVEREPTAGARSAAGPSSMIDTAPADFVTEVSGDNPPSAPVPLRVSLTQVG